MADNKGGQPPRPQPKPQTDFEKRDKGGATKVTSDQAPPPRPKKG
jgi:hypothetical protein